MPVYIDTSAFAKRYFNESRAAEFDAFLTGVDDEFVVTPLTIAEFESVVQRRLREGEFDTPYLNRTRKALGQDMTTALWQLRPFDPTAFDKATALIRTRGPLAALDALHLASALVFGCTSMATADRRLGRAAAACGLNIHDFSR